MAVVGLSNALMILPVGFPGVSSVAEFMLIVMVLIIYIPMAAVGVAIRQGVVGLGFAIFVHWDLRITVPQHKN
jgi:hypothetical protein